MSRAKVKAANQPSGVVALLIIAALGLVLLGKASPVVPVGPNGATKHLWAVTVDDWQTRTPLQAALLTDMTYWNGLRAKGHNFTHLDAANPAATAYATWTAKAGGPPALIVIDADSKKGLDAIKLPATTAGVDAELAKFGGS